MEVTILFSCQHLIGDTEFKAETSSCVRDNVNLVQVQSMPSNSSQLSITLFEIVCAACTCVLCSFGLITISRQINID